MCGRHLEVVYSVTALWMRRQERKSIAKRRGWSQATGLILTLHGEP